MIKMKSIMARCITLITCFIDLRALRIRVTRRTRKVRKTRTVLKACRLPAPLPPPIASIIISTIESITTAPSRRFIFSFVYFFGPRAKSFSVISTMKIQVNIKFINSRSSLVFSLMSYASIAIPIVLNRTHKVKKFSKRLHLMNAFMTLRTFFTVLQNPFGHTLSLFIFLSTTLLLAMLKLTSRTS